MTNQVTFPTNVGGDGSTVTDDSSATTGLANGGFRTRLLPMFTNIINIANWILGQAGSIAAKITDAETSASNAAASAATAVNAPGTAATSTTPLTIGTGNQSLTVQAGKLFVVGMTVTIANTASPTNVMSGIVTSYNSATGVLVASVTSISGSGTFAAWTVALSGAAGATGATGPAGVLPSGTITYSAVSPGAGYLKADGSVYSQSAYPALFAAVGSLPALSAPTGRSTAGPGNYTSVAAYLNGKFLVCDTAASLSTSPDGITWTYQSSLTTTIAGSAGGFAYGNGKYVCVGWYQNGGYAVTTTSTDAVNWTGQSRPLPSSAQLIAVAFGSGLFVAVGTTGVIASSSDGVTWTQRTSPYSSTWYCITYAAGLFVAAGASGTIATSPDGVTWTARASAFGGNEIRSIAYGNGKFVAVGATGMLATSPDGVTWTAQNTVFGTSEIYAVTFGNGFFVAGAYGGVLAASSDGATWTAFNSGGSSSGQISGLAYGNGMFVVTGTSYGAATVETLSTTYSSTSQFVLPKPAAYLGANPYIKT
ncbi:hypothetical protein [Paraburkholderia sp. DGU8]|uniref:hypothetical protein n=1 Tax=Paraburkholderia sp. DGU8 TaxID=3161997 RepID=UPI003466F998